MFQTLRLEAAAMTLGLASLLAGCATDDLTTNPLAETAATAETAAPVDRAEPPEISLPKHKLLIEHNATDLDTGFQIFVDGKEWNRLTITGPNGAPVATVTPQGRLRDFGFTELFLETQEPPNAEVPIQDVLARLPEGNYEFETRTIDNEEQDGETTFSHRIPAGPELTVKPAEGAVVSRAQDLVFKWKHVTRAFYPAGANANVTFYQLLVNRIDPGQPQNPNGFGRNFYEVFVPASVLSMRVPKEYLQANAEYEWEVFAIEDSGNQTFVTGHFKTN